VPKDTSDVGHIILYEEFVNENFRVSRENAIGGIRVERVERGLFENKTVRFLYRTTDIEWLSELIKRGRIKSQNKYISFSKNRYSGEDYDFGNIVIEFNANVLYSQGARDVEYNVDFFKKNPDIAEYVTGFKDQQEYMEGRDDVTKDWKNFITGFSNEEEVIIKELKMEINLIRAVELWPGDKDEADPKEVGLLKNLLNKYKVKLTVK